MRLILIPVGDLDQAEVLMICMIDIFFQTGTLTEGDLDLAGVCEIRENQFQVNFFCQIPDFTLNASWCEIIHCQPSHPELLTMQIDGKRVVL